MGSPNDVLGVLVRDTLPTEAEWAEMIESRRERLITQIFPHTTLASLGRVRCLRDGSGEYSNAIGDEAPEVRGDGRFLLTTHGVFKFLYGDRTFTYKQGGSGDGYVRGWGLTRKGEWVCVVVEFQEVEEWRGGNRWQYTRATCVTITEMPLLEMIWAVGIESFEVWYELGSEVYRAVAHTRNRLDAFEEMAAELRNEDALLAAIGVRVRSAAVKT